VKHEAFTPAKNDSNDNGNAQITSMLREVIKKNDILEK